MDKCLTIYDVTGIQEFIFASNKAKENIGGSIYVQNIFEKGLINCIKALDGNVKTDWENSVTFDPETDNLKAEVIYIGGGNALILFDHKTTAVDITKMLSKKILQETQGTLGIAVAHHKTNMDDFNKDIKNLFKKLNNHKNNFVQSTPLRGIAITRECEDGLSTSGKKSEENIYISDIAYKKRQLSKNEKTKNFPLDFDDLGQIKGESHIAVVHIDGNSMGRFINNKLKENKNYSKAVTIMREISSGLQKLYADIFKKMVKFCSQALENKAVQERIQLKNDYLPIRPIILNGDDVTFVCNGRIGIQLAEFFLKELAYTPLQLKSGKEILSACAGVAIVKSHFPFFRAYELAEKLCGSAKQKAKYLNKNIDDPGCWLDYHIIYSGFQNDIHAMRKQLYNIPGMDAVSRDVKDKFHQYNLLLRPFCVSGNSDEMYKWEKMKTLYSKMIKIPRSRLKNLRSAFISSMEAVDLQNAQNSSRGYKLPGYKMKKDIGECNDKKLFVDNQTPFFEPLELLDFYIPEFTNKDKGE